MTRLPFKRVTLVRLTWRSAATYTKPGTSRGPREPVAHEPRVMVTKSSSGEFGSSHSGLLGMVTVESSALCCLRSLNSSWLSSQACSTPSYPLIHLCTYLDAHIYLDAGIEFKIHLVSLGGCCSSARALRNSLLIRSIGAYRRSGGLLSGNCNNKSDIPCSTCALYLI